MKTNEKQTRETVIRHLKAPQSLTIGQVANFGLELSKNADGTVNLQVIDENCDKAFEILTRIQTKVEENAKLPTE